MSLIDNKNEVILQSLMSTWTLRGVEISSQAVFNGTVVFTDLLSNIYCYFRRHLIEQDLKELISCLQSAKGKTYVFILNDSDHIRGLLSHFSVDLLGTDSCLMLSLPYKEGAAKSETQINISMESSIDPGVTFEREIVERLKFYFTRESSDIKYFVARCANEPVGVLVLKLYENHAEIKYVATASKERRKKIASHLINTALSCTTVRHLEYSMLLCPPSTADFFYGLGFQEFERVRYYKYNSYPIDNCRKSPMTFLPNDVLERVEQYVCVITKLKALDLPVCGDSPKNWDSAAALDIILRFCDGSRKQKRILDAGGEFYSSILPLLEVFGFTQLHCINIAFSDCTTRRHIKYEYGDITHTKFPEETFDAIVCQSVIEHGIDIDIFLKEMSRILIKGGILIISTDYWHESIDTKDKYAYGCSVKVFNSADIKEIVKKAEEYRLKLVGDLKLECNERPVMWLGLEYTFIYFTLRKV